MATASPSPKPASRFWGVRPRLIVDVVLAISFLALMSVNLTGLLLHEWWGLGLMLLVIVHLLAQWDWTLTSTRGFLSRLTHACASTTCSTGRCSSPSCWSSSRAC